MLLKSLLHVFLESVQVQAILHIVFGFGCVCHAVQVQESLCPPKLSTRFNVRLPSYTVAEKREFLIRSLLSENLSSTPSLSGDNHCVRDRSLHESLLSVLTEQARIPW